MALVSIGPVAISHGDPAFSSSGRPTGHGIRSRTIAGSCSWAAWHTLDELVANEDAQTTVGGRTGVQEWLEFDDEMLGNFTGYYLLEEWNGSADHKASLTTTDVPFTLTAAYLGDLA